MKVFKTEIFPTNKQKKELINQFNYKRYIYNKMLDFYFLNDCKIPTLEIAAKFYKDIIENNEDEWIKKMNLSIIIEVSKVLHKELDNYIKHRELNNFLLYRPEYEKKKDITTSCIYFTNENILENFKPKNINTFLFIINKIENKTIEIKTECSLLFLLSKKIIYESLKLYKDSNDKYFLEINYRDHYENNRENDLVIGIDMGLKHPLSCYNSNDKLFYYDTPESLISLEKKLKHLNELNNIKYKKDIKEIKKKIDFIKKEFRENIAEELCRNYKIIKVEPFKSERSSNKIENSLLGINGRLFLNILKEKANQYNSNIIMIPNGTPTTQTCSECGYRRTGTSKMHLNERVFKCPKCKVEIPRDLNAAINIYNYKPNKKKGIKEND